MIARLCATVLLLTGLLVGCSWMRPGPPAAAPDLGHRLAGNVTADQMFVHLHALQDIANANKGNRAEGTPGYEASVDYVATALRSKGFEVSTPQFDRLYTPSRGRQEVVVSGRTYSVDQASLLVRTPPAGLTGRLVWPAKPTGCAATDYPAVAPQGAIAVVDDSGCTAIDKQNAAMAKGAAALIIVSEPGDGAAAALFPPRYYDQLTAPVAVVGAAVGAELRRTTATVQLTLDTATVKITSRNVLAQTKTGSTHDVVMVGAHLDSAPAGPGINDNGSGVAAVLETALQLGPLAPVTNAVRFAFWGAEVKGLNASSDYVVELSHDQLNDIALYLDFNMLGSPNAGFFTIDGDQSGPPGPGVASGDVPAGSGGIERTLAGYLNLAGKRPADMPLTSGTDYYPFMVAGVPIGGVTAGASQMKTNAQARLWGGQPGVWFDPNYQGAHDTIDNINREALAIMGSGVAFAVGHYAQSIEGVNGVPPHGKRHRTQGP